MKLSALGAIELQTEIERADYYKEDYGSATVEALKEVERLRTICQDIIDVIGTELLKALSPTSAYTGSMRSPIGTLNLSSSTSSAHPSVPR